MKGEEINTMSAKVRTRVRVAAMKKPSMGIRPMMPKEYSVARRTELKK